VFGQQNIFKEQNYCSELFVCACYVVTKITIKEGRQILDPKFVKHCMLAIAEENKHFKASYCAKTCLRCTQDW
jgi:hypothetical protein